jgi:hypothetical protein
MLFRADPLFCADDQRRTPNVVNSLEELFTAHPHAVGESYGEHFGVAMSYSLRLFAAAGAALVHAFLPFLCVTTASRAIKGMYADMTRRGATAPLARPAGEGQLLTDYTI